MLDEVYYQAHRGTLDEGPENTLAALRYGWQFIGAIPETDVRTTADGELVCIHDATLARTTNAPADISRQSIRELTLGEIRRWDAGICYSAEFAGARVPTLDEVLTELKQDPARKLYLEPKDAEIGEVKAYLDRHGVTPRVLFVSGYPEVLAEIQRVLPGAPAMTWIGGQPSTAAARLRQAIETSMPNISQLQVHLHPAPANQPGLFALDDKLLRWAMIELARRDIVLQVRPMQLSSAGLEHLLRLGVRWFVADAPGLFDVCLREAGARLASVPAADEIIFHIATAAAWDAAQSSGCYQAASLKTEGFIHCSTAEQVLPVANKFYRGHPELILLAIRAEDLGDSLVYEMPIAAGDTFTTQHFPHVYGPISTKAIIAAVPMPPTDSGDFGWPGNMPRT